MTDTNATAFIANGLDWKKYSNTARIRSAVDAVQVVAAHPVAQPVTMTDVPFTQPVTSLSKTTDPNYRYPVPSSNHSAYTVVRAIPPVNGR